MSIDPISLIATAVLTAAQMAMQASQKIEGQRLDDLNVSLADFGTPLNYSEGDVRSDGCPIFFAEPMKEVYRQRKTKGGKYDQWTYYGTWADAIADQRIAAVTRIWMDKHPVYDVTGTGPVTPFSIADGFNVADAIRFYLGTEDQEPDPRMLATVDAANGAGSCPAYRGVSYVMFVDIPTEKFGNRVPQVAIEWVTDTQPHYPYQTVEGQPPGLTQLTGFTFSPDFSRFFAGSDSYEIWDVAARSRLVGGTLPHSIYSNVSRVGVANDGTIYGINDSGYKSIVAFTPDGVGFQGVVADWSALPGTPRDQQECWVLQDGTGKEHIFTRHNVYQTFYSLTLAGVSGVVQYVPLDETGHQFNVGAFFTDSHGDIWAAATGDHLIYLYRLVDTGVRPGSPGLLIVDPSDTPSGIVGISATHHDDHFVVCWHGTTLFTIDQDSGAITGTASPSMDFEIVSQQFANLRPGASSIWLNASEISLADLSTIRTVDLTDWKVEDADGIIYDPVNNALICAPQYADVVTWRYLDRIASATVPLRTVVERVTGLVGLDLANIDASALDQGIRGYLWTRGSGKDILDPLLDAHDSFVRQHDFGLQFRKKGDASAGTIATPMFVRQGDVRYKVPITQDTDLPRYLSFSFSDVDADHQTNAVIAQRTADAVDTTRDVTINMTTLVLHVDEAKQLADRWFRRQWFESTGVENAFTMRELALEPGDVWTLDLDGNRATYRLTSTLIGADGVMPCKWVRDDPSLAELSGASGAAMDGRADSVITVGVIAKGFVLDIPLITDADNSVNPLLYYAAGPHATGTWPGATIYEAADGEYSIQFATVASSLAVTWGYTTEALGAANPWLWDIGNSVNVVLKNGMILSTTEDACDATPSVNLAMIGAEMIQFATATLELDGSYTLSDLKRGRRGTEWAVGMHAGGEAFVLLDRVGNVGMGASDVGTDLSFKAVTGGRDTVSAFPIPVSFTGASLKPYAPIDLDAALEAGSGDWGFTWTRRSRVGGAWTSGTSVPLGEASEAYELDILNGIGAVVRTISVTSPTATYSAADQISDFGSPQTSLDVVLYQISATVDRGFPATASF